jgi:glyoxylase-like metal-dependent hydrolase (beta-lactamase superfamily II)
VKVHHISCGFFRPWFKPLTYGKGGYLDRARYVAHCLLLEFDDRLALVDTGLGRKDMEFSLQRLGMGMTWGGGATSGTTAVEHVEALGFKASQVRDILVTHLDKDHTGGLRDFPDALVHVHPQELAAALDPWSFIAKQRYAKDHLAHKPKWSPLTLQNTQEWFGFPGAETPHGLPDGVLMMPLPGHSPGHCGIAVRKQDGTWLLHCGDAVYHAAWLATPGGRPPLAIQAIEHLLQHDAREREGTRRKLAAAMATGQVTVFASHDPVAFAELGGRE